MVGRHLLPESAFAGTPLLAPDKVWRRSVLRETIAAFADGAGEHYDQKAQSNLQRWHEQSQGKPTDVQILAGDWGEVTQRLTKEHGMTFAVLNMANAHVPGGGYIEGMVAQEENLFRRTNCHFTIEDAHLNTDRVYLPDITALLNGEQGAVYFDTLRPRVCVRGPEVAGKLQGYEWLPDDEVFPFFELRAAARDYRDGSPFDEADAQRRIRAQLDTLVNAKQRHVVLGASGCGAFVNPPGTIARIYREELAQRTEAFDCAAFAIYQSGYGPDNYATFRAVFEQ